MISNMLRSNYKSRSSSHPPRREMTIFSSLWSATALRSSLSWSSVTFWRSWPERASMMSLFSMSVARDSLTRRMRPSLSAASGRRICESIDCLASFSFLLPLTSVYLYMYVGAGYLWSSSPAPCCSCARRAFLIYRELAVYIVIRRRD